VPATCTVISNTLTSTMAVMAWKAALMQPMRMPRFNSRSFASTQAETTALPWPGPAACSTP
jgi:hypothetical protein